MDGQNRAVPLMILFFNNNAFFHVWIGVFLCNGPPDRDRFVH
jgi:hypothetical protein